MQSGLLSRDWFATASPEDVKVQLLNGADPDSTDPDGRTGLHHAAAEGLQLPVMILLDAGAAQKPDNYGWAPLHCAAAAEGRPGAIIPLLLEGGSVGSVTGSGITALHFAAMHGTVSSIEILLGAGADPAAIDGTCRTPLTIAAEAGHDGARELIARRLAEIHVLQGLARAARELPEPGQ